MSDLPPLPAASPAPPPRPPPSRIDPMWILLLFIGLAIAGYFFVKKMMVVVRAIDDCAEAGRRNCAALGSDSDSE